MGLSPYDQRRGGWRGPVKQIELKGDWGKTLAAMPVWTRHRSLAACRRARSIQGQGGRSGFVPAAPRPAQLVKERETGVIPFEEVKWARPKLARGLGGAPGSVNAVLKPGDVIYVSPREPKVGRGRHHHAVGGRPQGTMVASAGARDRRSARGHGSPYRPRARHRRRLQLRREPVRPRHASAPPARLLVQAFDLYDGARQWLHAVEHHRRRPNLPLSRGRHAAMVPEELRCRFGRRTVDLAFRHREVAQPDDGAALPATWACPSSPNMRSRFGVYDNLMPALSMALGAGETTLLRMVTGYSMICNGGKQIKATFIDRIQDRYGRTVWRHDGRDCSNCAAREWSGQQEPELADDRKQVIDPMSAFQMTSIMEGVVQSGTAQKLKVLEPADRRQDRHDQRLQGRLVRRLHARPRRRRLSRLRPTVSMGHGETGGTLAAPVVRDFLKEALADVPPVPFRAPARHQARARQPQVRLAGGARRQDRHHGGVQAWPGACWLGCRG